MSITTKEIAELCGVSRGTVDRALNNRPGINGKTRKQILETAEKLGYRPHFLARSLVKGSTMTLGVIVFDLYNRFFAQLFNSIEANARAAGYFTYLTLTAKEPDIEKQCVEHLAGRQVDGLILCSVSPDPGYASYLRSLGIPVVTVNNRIDEAFPFVGIDDYRAMQDATRHVISKGYERILYLSPALAYMGKSNIYAQQQRFEGYREVLDKRTDMESVVIRDKNYSAVLERLDLKDGRKTAILCTSDLYAMEVLHELKARNLSVPGDIGLMGCDRVEGLQSVAPPLATVSYPLEDIGAMAVRTFLSMREEEGRTEDVILPHTIVEGKSL